MSARTTGLLLAASAIAIPGCQLVFGLDSFEEGAVGTGGSGNSGGHGGADASRDGGTDRDASVGGAGGSGGTKDAGSDLEGGEASVCKPDCVGNTPRTCIVSDGGRQLLEPCTSGTACFGGACVQPSCAGLPTTCGPQGDESCCARRNVPGGNFHLSNDSSAPAAVSGFALDRFEVTVGRFRRFVAAVQQGYRVQPRDGTYPHVPNSGWSSGWPVPIGDIVQNLSCDPGGIYTWSADAGDGENRPIDCVSWYEAFAFCAWDGGRLPTEAEWNFAAAGGDEQRLYVWDVGDAGITLSPSYASYNCLGDGVSACALTDLIDVGTRPLGVSRWGHLDLTGNVFEWVFDVYQDPYPSAPGACVNCAALTGDERTYRGGSYISVGYPLETNWRGHDSPTNRFNDVGLRCARPTDP